MACKKFVCVYVWFYILLSGHPPQSIHFILNGFGVDEKTLSTMQALYFNSSFIMYYANIRINVCFQQIGIVHNLIY